MRIQSDLGRIQSGVGRIQSDLERIQLGLTVLKNFNGGVVGRWTFVLKNPMGILKRVNGALKKSGGGIV